MVFFGQFMAFSAAQEGDMGIAQIAVGVSLVGGTLLVIGAVAAGIHLGTAP